MTRALTVRQPFAWRIVHGTKRVENRTRPIQTRGLILIHAGAQPHDLFRGKPMDHLRFSAIVGAVHIVGSHHASTCGGTCRDIGGMYPGDPGYAFYEHVHHWELADAVAFDEGDVVPDVRGALGLWEPEPSHAYLASLALDAARARTPEVRRV
jgi:hypothetical protein